MDDERIDALGAAPIADALGRIDSIGNRRVLATYLGEAQRNGTPIPFDFWIDQDSRNPREYIVHFTQSGLGLPDRDYYLNDDAASKKLLITYAAYIGRLFELAGLVITEAGTEALLDFETRLADAQWSRVENRDRDRTYNKVPHPQLISLLSQFDAKAFLAAAGIDIETHYNVRQLGYAEKFAHIAAQTPLPVWKNYLRLRLLDASAPYLSQAFVAAHFDFNARTISGIERIEPRWKRAVHSIDGSLGELLGEIYVERYFKPEAKQRMDALVDNLKAAFREGIDKLDWMGEQTRAEARAKLAKLSTKIGHPDEWRDYSELEIHAEDLAGNVARARSFEYQREIAKLGGPVDRSEWFMSPQTVNAYYNPPMNEIVFPAAILQPPFFDVAADDAVNYGAIGAVIGHEVSHGFDDQGRKSDGDGVLRNWWTDADNEEFSRRAEGLVAQYSRFQPLPGEHINGELTLGENIGDLSGLAVAYKAYRRSLNGTEADVIDGLTGEQRFFVGWSRIWRYKYRDNELHRRLVTDPHSPGKYRVLGVLPNIDAFYEAFDIRPGDTMYIDPAERVTIW